MVSAADVVVYGLNIVVPLMTAELLKVREDIVLLLLMRGHHCYSCTSWKYLVCHYCKLNQLNGYQKYFKAEKFVIIAVLNSLPHGCVVYSRLSIFCIHIYVCVCVIYTGIKFNGHPSLKTSRNS